MFKLVCLLALVPIIYAQYEATWDSLDSRPLPQWYDDAKFGIFIHWGVFSVPSFGSEWFWSSWKSGDPAYVEYMNRNYPPTFTYQEFAKEFTAEFWDASKWADIFAASGAKYIILTSKHHEGYTMWPSKYSYSWNSQDVGPGRDIIGELGSAVKSRNLTFGLYHSFYEWFHPLYLADKEANYATRTFAETKALPEMYELVNAYEPSIIWSDGDWEAPDTYWNSTAFLAWLYNESPVKDVIVVNDRWGLGSICAHGGYYTCADRFNPGTLQAHKWENAWSIDTASWGFRRNAALSDYDSINDLLYQLASTVSCGGNLLLNIGPTKDGIIAPIFEERLRDMGTWLSINGESIYGTTPWTAQNDTVDGGVWYTAKGSAVYAISAHWPWNNNRLDLGSAVELFQDPGMTVTLLGNEDYGLLQWTVDEEAVRIIFPDKAIVNSEWAWVVKMEPSSNVNLE